jgi:predicted enzyme related to lactoylglutathione lyase
LASNTLKGETTVSERNGFSHGVPCWVDTWQNDPGPSVGFYEAIFGWEAENVRPPDASDVYFTCRLRGRDVTAIGAPIPEGAPPIPVWSTYIWVDSADETAATAKTAGGTLVVEPFESPDRGRMAVVADPEGAVFVAWEPGEHRGAQLVNEPGAWSMSILNTRAPDRAKAFYGELFGWQTEAFDMGGAEIVLFRQPGYEGGEPLQPVPRDMVAVMIEMDAHGLPKEMPPNWSVDFWIDDADAAVARAPEMGGAVIVPPSDSPTFRQAVIADPGGAAMSISQLLVPPR